MFVCVTACPGNQIGDGTACACPANAEAADGNGICPCPANTLLNGNGDSCDRKYYIPKEGGQLEWQGADIFSYSLYYRVFNLKIDFFSHMPQSTVFHFLFF